MQFLLDWPVEMVAMILGDWLTLSQICKLESAMCSHQNKQSLTVAYERLILKAGINCDKGESGQKFLGWLIARKVKVSSLQMVQPLPKSTGPILAILLTQSKLYLKYIRIKNCTETLTENCSEIRCPLVDKLCLEGRVPEQAQRDLLAMCPNITEYELRKAGNVDLSTLPDTAKIVGIYFCAGIVSWKLSKNVKEVSIRSSNLSDQQVAQILAWCPHVKFIDIGHNKQLSEATIVFACDAYKDGLFGLQVAGSDRLSATGLQNSISPCKNLQLLDISCLPNTTLHDTVFVTIAQNCTLLSCLSVFGNRLSDEALENIAKMKLMSLYMSTTDGYTERGVMALVRGCILLKNISIDHTIFADNPLVKLLWQELRPWLKFS